MPFNIKDIVAKNRLAITLILIAAFLRFYRLSDFVTFLGDQGRDAIVIRRILTFEHFPAIGAPSSLGQIFLGPFYYYFIAPFLLIFNYDPVGLAFGVALISIIGLILAYCIVKKESDFLTAILFLFFSTFSAAVINLSRFSWNPNLLPVFSFFTLYFFFKTLIKKNYWYGLIFGAFFSFSIQLHYLSILLAIPMFVMFIYNYFLVKESGSPPLINYLLSLLSFGLFSSPLIIFDLRHNFQNSKNFLKLFTDKNLLANSGFVNRLLETNRALFTHTFQLDINSYLALMLLSFIIVFYLARLWKKNNIFLNLNFLNLIFYIFFFSLLNSVRLVHYYGPVFFSFFMILAFLANFISKKKIVRLLLISLILLVFLIGNIKSVKYLFGPAGDQLKNAKTIAESIIADKPVSPYQVIALPNAETDGHIRYFLELEGVRPLEENTLDSPSQLYVLCFEKDCLVIGNPQWQIASFKNAKIVKIWAVKGVKIYKLIHELT